MNAWEQRGSTSAYPMPLWRMGHGQYVTDEFLCSGMPTDDSSPSPSARSIFIYGGWGGPDQTEDVLTDLWCYDLDEHQWHRTTLSGPAPGEQFPFGELVIPRRVELMARKGTGGNLVLLPFVVFDSAVTSRGAAVGLCEYSKDMASCGLMRLALDIPAMGADADAPGPVASHATWKPYGSDAGGLDGARIDAVTLDDHRSEVVVVGRAARPEPGGKDSWDGLPSVGDFGVWACAVEDGRWRRVSTGPVWVSEDPKVFGAFVHDSKLFVMAVTPEPMSLPRNVTVVTLDRSLAGAHSPAPWSTLDHSPDIYPSPNGYYHDPLLVSVVYGRVYVTYSPGLASGTAAAAARNDPYGEEWEISPDGEVVGTEVGGGSGPGSGDVDAEVPMTVSFDIPCAKHPEWGGKDVQVIVDQRARSHDSSRIMIDESVYAVGLRGGSWAVGLVLLSWYNHWETNRIPKGITAGTFSPFGASHPNGVAVEVSQTPNVIGTTIPVVRRTLHYLGVSMTLPAMFGHGHAMVGRHLYIHGGIPRPHSDLAWAALSVPDRAAVTQLHGLYRYHVDLRQWTPIVVDLVSGVCEDDFLPTHGRTFHTMVNSMGRLVLMGGVAMQTTYDQTFTNTDCSYDVGSGPPGPNLPFCNKVRVFDTTLGLWLVYSMDLSAYDPAGPARVLADPARYGHTAMAIRGGEYIIVFGGVPADSSQGVPVNNAVVSYKVDHAAKTVTASLLHPGGAAGEDAAPAPRHFHAAAGHDSSPYMYVHGGCLSTPWSGLAMTWYNCDKISDGLHRFHLDRHIWETMGPLAGEGRMGHSLIAIGPEVYVMSLGLRGDLNSGHDGPWGYAGRGRAIDDQRLANDLWLYDARRDEWRAHPLGGNMPAPREFQTLVWAGAVRPSGKFRSWSHSLVLVGGYTPGDRLDVDKEMPWEVDLACPAGSDASDIGLAVCRQCPPGTFSTGNADMCTSCPEGLTTAGPGAAVASACTLCVPGYCNGGACRVTGTITASAHCDCDAFHHGVTCDQWSALAWTIYGAAAAFGVVFLTSCIVLFLYKWLRARNTLYHLNARRGIPKGDGLDVNLYENEELLDFLIDPKKVYIEARIASGASAVVHRGRWNGHRVAVKEFVDSTDPSQVVSEALIMKRLHHPNITRMWGACILPAGPAVVLEHAERGSLTQVLASGWLAQHRTRVLHVALDVARGMLHLHSREPPILHRDLKPDNILIFSDHSAKIADFGISRAAAQHAAGMMTTNMGTLRYMAPEVLGASGVSYSTSADVFSYGMTMYTVLSHGRIPFDDLVWSSEVAAALEQGRRPPINRSISGKASGASDALLSPAESQDEALWSIVTDCWRQEPSERPSFMEVVERLERLL